MATKCAEAAVKNGKMYGLCHLFRVNNMVANDTQLLNELFC